MLAIAWDCKNCANFIDGSKPQILTDHRVLVPMLRVYSLNDFKNKRLQRLKLKIDHLDFEVQCVPGERNTEADALLQAPIDQGG